MYVESEVRRSPRIQSSSHGFKPEGCKGKNCYVCKVKPPTLKRSAIKKIAVNFCGMDEADLNNSVLQARKKRQYPVARARIVQLEPEPPTQEAENAESTEQAAAAREEEEKKNNELE